MTSLLGEDIGTFGEWAFSFSFGDYPAITLSNFVMTWERHLITTNKIFSLGTFWGWLSWEHPCWDNLRFKHCKVWRDNRLTGIRQNITTLLNILFSNILGRISRVTESTFIRTRSGGRMVITCRIFKRPHHGFATTHDRGASQFNWAPIFPWWKAFCILFLRYRPLKLASKLP